MRNLESIQCFSAGKYIGLVSRNGAAYKATAAGDAIGMVFDSFKDAALYLRGCASGKVS
jgi:hypothetical protein